MEDRHNFQVNTVQGKQFSCLEGDTILNSALSSGIMLEHSCKDGRCGVCKVALIEGEVREVERQVSLEELDKGDYFLACCCTAASDVLIDAVDLDIMMGVKEKALPAKINQLERLSDNVVRVELRLPPTSDFKFLEGQFIDVSHSSTVGRSYSIASTSCEKTITLLIKKVPDGVLSNYWFNMANVGDLLRIKGPKGTFCLRNHNKPLIFLATGTGIAPIISMLTKMDLDPNFDQSCQISLFWGNRLAEDFVWEPDFRTIEVEFIPVISRPDKSWSGEKGYVQDIALSRIKNLKDVDVYACGSNTMIDSARKSFVSRGVKQENFYSDAFLKSG